MIFVEFEKNGSVESLKIRFLQSQRLGLSGSKLKKVVELPYIAYGTLMKLPHIGMRMTWFICAKNIHPSLRYTVQRF